MVFPHFPPLSVHKIKQQQKKSCLQTDERSTCYSSLNVQPDSPPSSALCIDTESSSQQNKLWRVCNFFHQNKVEYSQPLIPTTAPTCVQSVNHKLS